MKIYTLVVAFVLAIPYPTSAEDAVFPTLNAPQFTVQKTTWQDARHRKCRRYGESCLSRPAMPHEFWRSYDGLVDNCCVRWLCLYPGPTCQ